MQDGYAEQLSARETAALQLTDTLIGLPQLPDAQTQALLKQHFSPAEIVELTMSVGLFLGMSKVLITLGLEPDSMPVTVMPTPGKTT